jgi:MFS family permease
MLIVSLDQYIVVVALPDIGREVGFSEQTLQAVVSAYAVASGGLLLFGGRAADVLGRRRLLVAGLALYACGSLAGGVAATPVLLLAARAVQGLGGALVFPATLSLVNTTFSEGDARNRAVALWGAAGAAGLVIGVLLGGVLTQGFGWEAVFLINVPLAGGAALAAIVLVPPDRPRERGRRLDLPGAGLATLALTSLVFTLVEGPNRGWSSMPAVIGATVASITTLGFAAVERRSPDPLVSPRLLSNRSLRTAMAIAFLFWATFGSILYLLSVYLQVVLGYDALEAGVGFLLPTAVVVAGSALAGRLASRIGLRTTTVSALVVGSVGAVALGLAMTAEGAYLALVPGLVAVSVGDGIVFTTMFIAAGDGVSDEHQGVASGLASTSTSVGAAIGLAVLSALATGGTEGLGGEELLEAQAEGLRTAVFAVAIGIAVTVVLATRLPSSERRTRDA